MMSTYQNLAARAPAGSLQEIVSDLHLSGVAGELDEDMMVNSLCPVLGLKTAAVKDIQKQHRNSPRAMRIALLRKWTNRVGINATYENLVKALLKVDEGAAALFVVDLLAHSEADGGSSGVCSSGVHGTLVTGVGGSGTPPCAPAVPSSAQAGLSPATVALKNRKPTSRDLVLIQYQEAGKTLKLHLVDRVSSKWRSMGLILNIDRRKLDSYEQGSTSNSWLKVMQQWLDGRCESDYSVTWNGLCELLQDAGEPQVATDLMIAVQNACS